MVKVDYSNISLKKDNITPYVKGFPISLIEKELGECLEIPYVRAEIRGNHDDQLPNYVKKDFYYDMSIFLKDDFFLKKRKING